MEPFCVHLFQLFRRKLQQCFAAPEMFCRPVIEFSLLGELFLSLFFFQHRMCCEKRLLCVKRSCKQLPVIYTLWCDDRWGRAGLQQQHQSGPSVLSEVKRCPSFCVLIVCLALCCREAGVLLQPNAEVPFYNPLPTARGQTFKNSGLKWGKKKKEEEKEEISSPLNHTSPSTSDNTLM